MMTTRQDQSGLLVSRCMALAAKESAVDLLFHTNTETGKTDELLSDPHVNMAFIKPNTVNPSFSSYSFSNRADFDFFLYRANGPPSPVLLRSIPTAKQCENITPRA
jgi:hypothetical protein